MIDLSMGVDYAKVMFGQNAVHVGAFMWVQDGPTDTVSFIGASKVPGTGKAHPLRFGSTRTHQLVRCDLVLRPHLVIGTDIYQGHGIGNLLLEYPDPAEMLAAGETVLDIGGHQ